MVWLFRAALWLSVAMTLAFWWERTSYLSASSELGRFMARRILPFQLVGLELPFPQLLQMSAETPLSADAARHLVFVVSDSCHFCQEARPQLCALTRLGELTSRDEVLFVSLEGTQLTRELAACGLGTPAHMAVGVPRNQMEFVMRTSLAGTPAAVLLDSRWRIRRSFINGQFDEIQSVLRDYQTQ